ncbi:MAG: 6-bladed beta-propeller [Acidobacteriota bacterium]
MRLDRKLTFLGLIFICLFLCACRREQGQIERFSEDGVEVVVNHERPSKISGEPAAFSLEEESKIDTESEALAELGIRNVDEFEIGAEGSVFLSTGTQVFQFDKAGNYVRTMGRTGQGPGEYQMGLALRIMDSGELCFFDGENGKFLFFQPDASWKEDIRKDSTIFTFQAFSLENGHFVLQERWDEQDKGIRRFQ